MKRSCRVLVKEIGQGIGLRALCWMAVLLAMTVPSFAADPVFGPADLVIRHAHVYTVDEQHPWAEAVVVRGDRIAWVGSDAEAVPYIRASTKVVDAGGRLLLPGFIDSHFHALLGGDPDVFRVQNNDSLQAIQQQVKDFARQHPKLKWIEVEGWNYSAFPDGSLPTAKDLEGLTGGRPAFLVAYDYHTIWMNREALKEFGITRNTKSVIFAEGVEKDPKTGEPTGILTGFGSTGLSQEAEAELRQHLPSHMGGRRCQGREVQHRSGHAGRDHNCDRTPVVPGRPADLRSPSEDRCVAGALAGGPLSPTRHHAGYARPVR
jgi:hypothetical protein